MKTKRLFFVSDDLDDLERMEEELERAGIVTPQIHVLTLDDGAADRHSHLHSVSSFMKKDVVHSTLVGASFGVVSALAILLIAWLAGWTQSAAGWLPFVFLAVIALGFCTWEGGLRGIQTPNVHFQRFQQALEQGQHVFFVDAEPAQEQTVTEIARQHTGARPAGSDHGAPGWLVFGQHRVKRFFVETFP